GSLVHGIGDPLYLAFWSQFRTENRFALFLEVLLPPPTYPKGNSKTLAPALTPVTMLENQGRKRWDAALFGFWLSGPASSAPRPRPHHRRRDCCSSWISTAR